MKWMTLVGAIAFVGCGREPVASDIVGSWKAEPGAIKLLKGRPSAATHGMTFKPDGSALFENVPDGAAGPLLNGAGTWRLRKSSGRTIVEGTLPSQSFEIVVDGSTLYIDLTDPDQMERFTYVRTSP